MSLPTQASSVDDTSTMLEDAPRRRLSTETKASFKTTELFAYLGAVVGVLLASQLIGTEDRHDDYFRAVKDASSGFGVARVGDRLGWRIRPS